MPVWLESSQRLPLRRDLTEAFLILGGIQGGALAADEQRLQVPLQMVQPVIFDALQKTGGEQIGRTSPASGLAGRAATGAPSWRSEESFLEPDDDEVVAAPMRCRSCCRNWRTGPSRSMNCVASPERPLTRSANAFQNDCASMPANSPPGSRWRLRCSSDVSRSSALSPNGA